jgi:hypothetical protein
VEVGYFFACKVGRDALFQADCIFLQIQSIKSTSSLIQSTTPELS